MAAELSVTSADSSRTSSEELSQITLQEVKSKDFRRYMTILMNAFRNALFKVVKANGEVDFSSSTTGSFAALIPPSQEGAKELFGSCRNNIRFALSGPAVFVSSKGEKVLSGVRASSELWSFIQHHREKDKKTISEKSLKEMEDIVKGFCDFLLLSLKDGVSLQQFRLAIETKYGSEASLWPPGCDSTYSPGRKRDDKKCRATRGKRGRGKMTPLPRRKEEQNKNKAATRKQTNTSRSNHV